VSGLIGALPAVPEYVFLALITGCLLVISAVLYIIGRAVLGTNAEPARRLTRLLRAARGN
jgi:hypothetical protein